MSFLFALLCTHIHACMSSAPHICIHQRHWNGFLPFLAFSQNKCRAVRKRRKKKSSTWNVSAFEGEWKTTTTTKEVQRNEREKKMIHVSYNVTMNRDSRRLFIQQLKIPFLTSQAATWKSIRNSRSMLYMRFQVAVNERKKEIHKHICTLIHTYFTLTVCNVSFATWNLLIHFSLGSW